MRNHDRVRERPRKSSAQSSFRPTTTRPRIHSLHERSPQTTDKTSAAAAYSSVRQRLAAQNNRDRKTIRHRNLQTRDESDRVSRQDREDPRHTGDNSELEHDRKSRGRAFEKLG